MLHDFTYYNPTKIYFGKDSMQNLSAELANYGKNILLIANFITNINSHKQSLVEKWERNIKKLI